MIANVLDEVRPSWDQTATEQFVGPRVTEPRAVASGSQIQPGRICSSLPSPA